MNKYAAVLTHVPNDETFYTPFEGDNAGRRAHAFREAEEERGDFPGSLWAVVMNEPAAKELVNQRLEMFGLVPKGTEER